MTPNLYCPISQEIMTDPVICSDGTTYQREHIQRWLSDHNTSPLTGLPLDSLQLTPNLILRTIISDEFPSLQMASLSPTQSPPTSPNPPSSPTTSTTFFHNLDNNNNINLNFNSDNNNNNNNNNNDDENWLHPENLERSNMYYYEGGFHNVAMRNRRNSRNSRNLNRNLNRNHNDGSHYIRPLGADYYNNDNNNNLNDNYNTNNQLNLWARLGVIIDSREDLNSQNIPINPVRMINEEFIEVSQNDIRSIMSLLNALSNANQILMN